MDKSMIQQSLEVRAWFHPFVLQNAWGVLADEHRERFRFSDLRGRLLQDVILPIKIYPAATRSSKAKLHRFFSGSPVPLTSMGIVEKSSKYSTSCAFSGATG